MDKPVLPARCGPYSLPQLALCGLALVGGLAFASAASAADAHAAAPAAAPAAHAAPAPAAGAREAKDSKELKEPLELIRQRLTQKLGAVPTPPPGGATAVPALQVASRASGELHFAAGKPAAVAARSRTGAREKASTAASTAASAEAAHAHEKMHWSYQGEGGPDQWGKLHAENVLCSIGKRQSPIDIRDGFPAELEPITFDYRDSTFSVVNNGHTLQANMGSGNSIEVGGRRYELLQFHFHHPAEERINGRSFDMVVHLVHRDAEGRLAVVAVLLNRGNVQQPVVQAVWNNLPLETSMPIQARSTLDPAGLLPDDRRYFTYMGSLTTPPCTEGVLWLVIRQPVSISPAQREFFARLFPMNARPIQSAAGRIIKQSN